MNGWSPDGCNQCFHTSIPKFDFPGPVVFTANAKEEEPAWCPIVNRRTKTLQLPPKVEQYFDRLMFVRLRVSSTNLEYIRHAVSCWTAAHVPVVLTFMVYDDQDPPTREWMRQVMLDVKRYAPCKGRWVTMCGALDSGWCKDCHNCESYYWQTKKHMIEAGIIVGEVK